MKFAAGRSCCLAALLASASADARWSGCSVRAVGAGAAAADGALASLAAAQAAARLVQARPAVVCLSGVFSVADAPLALTAEDSNITWRGVGGGAVVSGGLPVSDWQPATLGGGAAYVSPVPAGWPAAAVVRQLWSAGGTRAARTAVQDVAAALGGLTPWAAGGGGAVGFVAGADIPAAWADNSTQAIEFVWPIVIANWIAPRCTVAAIAGRNITLAAPCGAHLLKRNVYDKTLPAPVVAEAVPAFPLPANTFYHDVARGLIYFAPTSPAALADVWVSASEALVTHANVSGVVWQGITFQYSTWWQANSGEGFVDEQSAVFACTVGTAGCAPASSGNAEPPAAVRVAGSTDCAFVGCNFTNMGSPYALSVAGSSQRVNVTACQFTELSGGFLKLGSVVDTRAAAGSASTFDADFVVEDNVASGLAVEYAGAAGLFAGFIYGATISHNTISDAGYSGVSLGWGWGDTVLPGLGANAVTFNRISNVMTQLRDGGGIYVNGATSAPNLMSDNWVDHDEAVYAVFYLDNGSSDWLVTRNVASASPLAWAFFMTGGGGVPEHARNNHLDTFWYEDELAPVNNCAQLNCTVDAATVYKVTGGAWPAEAQAIMDASGARV